MIEHGTRVRYTARHLRSTGQYTGPEAPAHVGPFARGTVVQVRDWNAPHLAEVRWDNGETSRVLLANLEVTR